MSGLSPRARDLFARARQSGAPTASQRAELLARVEAAAPTSASSRPPVAATGSGTAVLAGAVVVVVAAVLIVLAGTARPSADVTRGSHAARAPASLPVAPPPTFAPAKAAASDVARAVVPAVAPASHVAVRSGVGRAAPEVGPGASEVGGAVRARLARHIVPAVPSTDDLAAELVILRRAQAARRQHQVAAALAALDEHASRFPHGVLATERQVTRALVLCESGRLAEGRALAAPFAASAWSTSLSRACAGENASP